MTRVEADADSDEIETLRLLQRSYFTSGCPSEVEKKRRLTNSAFSVDNEMRRIAMFRLEEGLLKSNKFLSFFIGSLSAGLARSAQLPVRR
jgi:hypothetical protein